MEHAWAGEVRSAETGDPTCSIIVAVVCVRVGWLPVDKGTDFIGDAPRAWGENESEVFVEFGRAMVPGREEIERTLLELLPAGRDEPFVGVEIGTGTGWLSAAVLREFSGARIIGLDGSPEMLRKTRELLATYGERAELRPFRLEELSWTEELPPVRVFLSSSCYTTSMDLESVSCSRDYSPALSLVGRCCLPT